MFGNFSVIPLEVQVWMNNTGTFSSKLRKTQHFVNVIALDCWRIIPTVWHLNLNSNQWYFYLISMAHLDDKLNFYSNSKIFQNVVNLSVWWIERWKCQYFHSFKTDLWSKVFLYGQKQPSISRWCKFCTEIPKLYPDKWQEKGEFLHRHITRTIFARNFAHILAAEWNFCGF